MDPRVANGHLTEEDSKAEMNKFSIVNSNVRISRIIFQENIPRSTSTNTFIDLHESPNFVFILMVNILISHFFRIALSDQ